MRKSIYNGISFIILLFCLCFLFQTTASGEAKHIPKDLIPAFNNLLAFTKGDNDIELNNELLERVLDFVASSKDLGGHFSLGGRQGGSSDYYEFKIDRSLSEVLGFTFHPDIPPYITAPSSVHLSYWIGVNGDKEPLRLNPDILDDSSDPVVIRGREFLENTPDTNSGAYYSYELDRAIIYTKHHGNRVLISMSEQRGRSSVGKKALILSSDDEWSYLYTGEKGCTVAGLGWVSSYIYNSSGIIVYYETTDPYPQVKYSIFKWIKAGWSGLNLVKSSHLRKGAERYAKAFKEILESTAVQDVSKFSEPFRQIKNLSIEELRIRASLYFEELKKRHQEDNRLCRKWFMELFQDDLYLESLTRDELEAIVNKEYLKYMLGRPSTFKHIDG